MQKKHQLKIILPIFLLVFVLAACSSSKQTSKTTSSTKKSTSGKPKLKDEQTFLLQAISKDKSYGYTEDNPIMVGNSGGSGPANERRFLNALAGPKGESIQYTRLGSCCTFNTDNGFMGKGLLDRYKVTWQGQTKEVILYINMYDYEPLEAPLGFTIRD